MRFERKLSIVMRGGIHSSSASDENNRRRANDGVMAMKNGYMGRARKDISPGKWHGGRRWK